MLKSILKLIFGDKQTRDVKKLRPIVDEINKIHEEIQNLSDEELQNKTNEFRKLLAVVPRNSRVAGQVVVHENAEQLLATHPDIAKAVFTGSRRDAHEGHINAWVKIAESAKASADLVGQIRSGMTRLGPGYSPKNVYFVDEFPVLIDARGKEQIDYNSLMFASDTIKTEDWTEVRWSSIASTLNVPTAQVELMDLLPEAFATMKEVCRRFVGKKWTAAGVPIEWAAVPYDVQLMGAISLASGNISEMGTGEGKTLTAIFPMYLHALTGRGAHLVTVNDYLARRDSEWKEPLFNFLGLTVGCLDKTESHTPERRVQYLADITYGTVNEFGFDYLRDNMARSKEYLMQRDLYFAIIDEVDSVLIDEARTPLIISGPVDRSTAQYDRVLPSIRELVNKQNTIISKVAAEAEELLGDDKELTFEAGFKLLVCGKGSPKHKRYMKLRQEPTFQRLQEKVELELMREKKVREVEEHLYFVVDEKNRMIELTEMGRQELSPNDPEYFVLPDVVDQFARIEANPDLTPEEKEEQKRVARAAHDAKAEELHTISQLLNAFVLKQRDVDYVIEENKVVIVDENTGRKMSGRRWSDGLHQAVEAKEGVKIEAETQTLATITIQNYFRMYSKLSGMTGTAETEAAEFHATYGMDVITIPPNRPISRKDMDDLVYRTKREKYAAVIDEVERLHKMGLPILVGTTSVHDSEKFSKMLQQRKMKHNVLNAKNNAQEARIVSEAGQIGAITIATNMAGRGTDIKLGPGVSETRTDEDGNEHPGGLQIIGTERHESRRIDRQLRGRSGRQGDPGASRFFVSLEDDLMRWFGSERISVWLQRMGMKEGEAIENPLVTRSITNAQKKVEMINYERRQRTLKFDNVMNNQRKQVYSLRRDLLVEDDVRDIMLGIFEDAIDAEFDMTFGEKSNMGDADIAGFVDWVAGVIATEKLDEIKQTSWADYDDLHNALMEHVAAAFDDKYEDLDSIALRFCKVIGLQTIDNDWQDHLLAIDDLRDAVYNRSIGQKDPLIEFTRDANGLFTEFMLTVNKNIFQTYFRAQPAQQNPQQQRPRVRAERAQKPQTQSLTEAAAAAAAAQQKS